MDKITHFCQKCREANDSSSVNCRNCGTRLMIITFPKSQRNEEEIEPSYYEDHLLERVSLLEFRLAQVTEQVLSGYEFILKQAKAAERGHALMQSFCESLKEVSPELSEVFAEEFSSNFFEKKHEKEIEDKRRKMFDDIVSLYKGTNIQLFIHLLEEGIRLLAEDEEKQAFQTLDRAILLSPDNVSLLIFIAGNLFRTDRFEQAKNILETAYKIKSDRVEILLLLSVIYADEGEIQKSFKFLSMLLAHEETRGCANYIWGMLSASENKWKEALVAFKEVWKHSESSEILYLIGSAYFQLNDYHKSLEFLSKATSLDAKFADAWFMQCAVYRRLEEKTKSAECLKMADSTMESGEKCLDFLRTKEMPDDLVALPFLHMVGFNKCLLTGGSLRMRVYLLKDIFELVS